MASDLEPTVGEVEKLFEKVEAHFPSQSLGAQRWYLLTVSRKFPVAAPFSICQI